MMGKSVSLEKQRKALLSIMRTCASFSANMLFYITALGAVTLIAHNTNPDTLSPAITMLMGSVGANTLAETIRRIAREKIDEAQLKETIANAIKDSGIETALQDSAIQRNIGALMREQGHLRYAIKQGQEDIAVLLMEQAGQYVYLFNELHSELLDIKQDMLELKSGNLRIFEIVQEINTKLPPNTDTKGMPDADIELEPYARQMLEYFKAWQERHTPLFAEYREFEIFAVKTSGLQRRGIPVVDILNVGHELVLLGESGSGKTDALWKIAVDICNRIIHGTENRIPIKVDLRNWRANNQLRQLVQNIFSQIDVSKQAVETALRNGKCIILIDGLNELPLNVDNRDEARRDLAVFRDIYPLNQYIFTCRTADYAPDFVKDKLSRTLATYEIQRLNQDQITEFVHRYFQDTPSIGENFIRDLDVNNDFEWETEGSFIHLARIPLHLLIMISEYKRTFAIPRNKSKVLEILIQRMAKKLEEFQTSRVNLDLKKRILGRLAYLCFLDGYYLSIPQNIVTARLEIVIRDLKSQGEIPQTVMGDDIWKEILSNNFLSTSDYGNWETIPDVQWLHQLIYDYFFAYEINRMLVLPGVGADELKKLVAIMHYSQTKLLEQPCQIALGLLDSRYGALLLLMLIRVNGELAQKALEGQNEGDAAKIGLETASKLTNYREWDEERLLNTTRILPYISIINGLIDAFKRNRIEVRRSIAKAVSQVARDFHGTNGGKRASQILESWIANNDDYVKFYAAMGLWGRDKGRAAMAFKELTVSKNAEIRGLVHDVTDEWNIE